MTVAFQRMFRILERWNNNQVTSSLSKQHELSYRSNNIKMYKIGKFGSIRVLRVLLLQIEEMKLTKRFLAFNFNFFLEDKINIDLDQHSQS